MPSLKEILEAKRLAASVPAEPTELNALKALHGEKPVDILDNILPAVSVEDVRASIPNQTPLLSAIAASQEIIDLEVLGETNQTILADAILAVEDIVPRIRQLNSLSDLEVESEMKLLKDALLANPEAVSLMLPTDVGSLVVALRRITKEAIIKDAAEKAAKVKKPKAEKIEVLKMTKEQMLDVTDF